MLGENHSLLNEFPELKENILTLIKEDKDFSRDAKKYDTLDREIRELELQDSPIGDDEMHVKKRERAVLKDLLYNKLKVTQ